MTRIFVHRILVLVIITALLLTGALAARQYPIRGGWGQAGQPSISLPPGDGPWVVRARFTSREMLDTLTQYVEPWEVDHQAGTVVVMVDRSQAEWMEQLGFQPSVDPALTAALNQPRTRLPGQITGIPGYPCYRTVEETYTTSQNIVAAHPTLATWLAVGETWDKQIPGGPDGYNLYVLRLTNALTAGPKPRLFVMSSIHAREYTPAELNTRFAEYLVNHYGADADVTWLLDYHEIHLLLQANPDGRKLAEAGLSWRKNTHTGCINPGSRGVDLNRNFEFEWDCCGGSSGDPCYETYRGPTPASEPETRVVQNYVRSIFADLRENDLLAPAPLDTPGIFLDLHSYSELVIWPWGFAGTLAPNAEELQTLGRRMAYLNNYTPQQAYDLYTTDGTTDDFAYGDLGVPAYTFEMGTNFFQNCSTFENSIVPANLPALLYAARVARAPYMTPAGPDALGVSVTPTSTMSGGSMVINATIDDTRTYNLDLMEPTQTIAAAEYYIDVPPWETGYTPISYTLSAADGLFDAKSEAVTGALSIHGLANGRHILFVRGQDAAGNWGPVSAAFFYIDSAWNLYLPSVQR